MPEDYIEATIGMCPADCSWLPLFLCLFLVMMFATFMGETAGHTAIIRFRANNRTQYVMYMLIQGDTNENRLF